MGNANQKEWLTFIIAMLALIVGAIANYRLDKLGK